MLMENIINTIRNIFFRPSEFFNTVCDEKGYARPWLFFSISYIILVTISMLLSIPLLLRFSDAGLLLIFIELFGLIISIGFGFAIPFVSAALSHTGLLILGAKKGFYNTFKPVSYSGIIFVIYGLIIAAIKSVSYIFYPGNITDFQSYIGLLFDKAPGPLAFLEILVITITIAGWIHLIVAETIGVSRFQGISRARAFFGIILVPSVILALIALLAGSIMFLITGSMPSGMVTLH